MPTFLTPAGAVDTYAWYDIYGERHLIFSKRDWVRLNTKLARDWVMAGYKGISV